MINSQLYITVRIFIILILIQSCVSKKQEIVRDDAGNIILKCELKNGVRHGKCYEYYPDGAVNVVSHWAAGVLEGEKTYYFKSGNVQSTGMYKAGEREGEFLWYFETGGIETKMLFINGRGKGLKSFDEDGNMKEMHEYIYLTDEPQLNRKMVFNTGSVGTHFSDAIVEESDWVQIDAAADTVYLGDFAEYELQWLSDADYVSALTGNFDHKFNVIDSTSLKRIDLDNKNRFYPAHLGTDTIRIIFDFFKHEDGKEKVFSSHLEKVFTVIEK